MPEALGGQFVAVQPTNGTGARPVDHFGKIASGPAGADQLSTGRRRMPTALSSCGRHPAGGGFRRS